MEIEKTGITEYYSVRTDKYYISLEGYTDFNIGYSEFQILNIQDQTGLEVHLSKKEENKLKDTIVEKIEKCEIKE